MNQSLYNPEFVQAVRQRRAEAERQRIAEALDPAHILMRLSPLPAEIAPQLAAATMLRRGFDEGVVEWVVARPTLERLAPGRRLWQPVMLESGLIHLLGQWASPDGIYHGSLLELTRLLGHSGASFVRDCLAALALRGFVERVNPGQLWRLSDDGWALHRELSGSDLDCYRTHTPPQGNGKP